MFNTFIVSFFLHFCTMPVRRNLPVLKRHEACYRNERERERRLFIADTRSKVSFDSIKKKALAGLRLVRLSFKASTVLEYVFERKR